MPGLHTLPVIDTPISIQLGTWRICAQRITFIVTNDRSMSTIFISMILEVNWDLKRKSIKSSHTQKTIQAEGNSVFVGKKEIITKRQTSMLMSYWWFNHLYALTLSSLIEHESYCIHNFAIIYLLSITLVSYNSIGFITLYCL